MKAWTRPELPNLPGTSQPPLLYDTATRSLIEARPEGTAGLYVCGITPYDATHIGHAATYVAFDTLQRVWLDGGFSVRYTQNITDIDDPLIERARANGVDWRDLGAEQIQLFRDDMAHLSVLPPDDFIGVTEVIDEVARAVKQLLDDGFAYTIPNEHGPGDDIYFDNAAAETSAPWHLGDESNYDEATMLALMAERGGDPDRVGKRNPLDPLLWQAERPGDPSWPSVLGSGRPGWHIECSVIALMKLGPTFDVQGGGSDLIFPHHEFSAGHAAALSGAPLAQIYSHTGMVAYHGEKMSKSLGNLVLVSRLRDAGVDPCAIRLVILGQHYRSDWEWTDRLFADAFSRLAKWRIGFNQESDVTSSHPETRDAASDVLSAAQVLGAAQVLSDVRAALHDDLDTPTALAIIDNAAAHGVDDPELIANAVRALLGVRVR